MRRLDPAARVRLHIDRILAGGPIDFDEMVQRLVESDLLLGPDPEDRIDDVLETMPRVRVQCVPGDVAHDAHAHVAYDRFGLIDGSTWTVRVGDLDVASDTVPYGSLGLLWLPIMSDWCHFDGGAEVGYDSDGRRQRVANRIAEERGDPADAPDRLAIAFPEGWFASRGIAAGDYLHVHVAGDVLTGSGSPGPIEAPAGLVEALRGAVHDVDGEATTHFGDQVLEDVLSSHPELRRSTFPPLDELFDAADLERSGLFIAPRGFDFKMDRLRALAQDTADTYEFDEPELAAFVALLVAWTDWRDDPASLTTERTAAAARATENLRALAAFLDNELYEELGLEEVEALTAFGQTLFDAATGRHRAGPAWFVAQIFFQTGQTNAFEEWVDIAQRDNPGHPGVAYARAWLAYDRGEARAARSMLAQFDDLFDHDLDILDAVLAPHAPVVGRNAQCPCGSGRKYKHCHLGVDEIGLDRRLTWLYRKANWWLGERFRGEVEEAAWVRARNAGVSPSRLLEIDPLIADAVLAEGGRFAQWLDERGALLPSDEAMLAGQWALIDRSVFEVTEIRLGEGITLRDVRTGDVVEVDERAGSHDVRVGGYVLVRPLPTGTGRYQLFGGITRVPDAMLDRFLELLDAEPGPDELLGLVAEAEAPPSVSNREGDPTVLCEYLFELGDPDSAVRILDETFDKAETAGEWTWLADPEEDPDQVSVSLGGHTIRGTLRLDGSRLVCESNSVPRIEALAELIENRIGEVTLIEALQSDLEDVLSDRDYERSVFGDDSDGDDVDMATGPIDLSTAPPEIRRAIRAQMDAYEVAWVDESIPALGGITPRQALDDPTRRDDLLRLLDRMEEQEMLLNPDQAVMGMRTARLRELLGL